MTAFYHAILSVDLGRMFKNNNDTMKMIVHGRTCSVSKDSYVISFKSGHSFIYN